VLQPQQIEAAYGIVPLPHQGIDGRGQTVVLPELAEPEFPLPTSDIRQDFASNCQDLWIVIV